MNNLIVNISTGAYCVGQERLRKSLEGKFNGDILFWNKVEDVGAPSHFENPYAFKVYAFEKAISLGYTNILWLDASVYCIKDTKPVFDVIESEGYIMQNIGHAIGRWTNDICLSYFNMTRDEAMTLPCYGNAGFLGLNFNFDISKKFFQQWKQAAIDGMFKGEWNNNNKSESQDERCSGHRHDLSCGSIISHRLGMEYKHPMEWLQYGAPDEAAINETIIFKAQGIV